MDNPLTRFKHCWNDALLDSPLKQKAAICVTTINEQGFPEGRFVDLKAISDEGLIFCTQLDSNKALQIEHNNKVGMTIWWDHVGYQIRLFGRAEKISDSLAKQYWQSRKKSAQVATVSFDQSKPLESEQELSAKFNQARVEYRDVTLDKPDNWGGFEVTPESYEFWQEGEYRIHDRFIYERDKAGSWKSQRYWP